MNANQRNHKLDKRKKALESYPLVILAVLFRARHAVKEAKGIALASCELTLKLGHMLKKMILVFRNIL